MSPAAAHWSFCCSRIAIETASSRLTARSVSVVLHACSIACSDHLFKLIRKIAVGHGQTHAVQRRPGHRPRRETRG